MSSKRLAVAGLLFVVALAGCRRYPAVTSRESLSLMKLLYTACNTRDEKRLAEVEKGVEKASREGKLSPAEREAFAEIIGRAKQGEWQRAEKAAFRFAQDQVGQGHPAPKDDGHRHEHKGKGNKGGK